MAARGVLRTIEGGALGFWCPGCQEMHVVNSGWSFNGDFDRPTLSPSILVRGGHYAPGWQGPDCWCNYAARFPDAPAPSFKCDQCHSFVRDGQIQFLGDCTHQLAGRTVPLTAPPEL